MSPKDPTVYDVAKEAGVSITTVSRVLNTPTQVRESTRTRVLEAIDKLGFVPRADARDRPCPPRPPVAPGPRSG